jgi:hypothetical protein
MIIFQWLPIRDLLNYTRSHRDEKARHQFEFNQCPLNPYAHHQLHWQQAFKLEEFYAIQAIRNVFISS